GFDPSRLLVGRITLPEATYIEPQRMKATFRQIDEAARAIPGVERAALVDRTPMSGGSSNGLNIDGRGAESLVQSDLHLVSPGYFATARIPVKIGRTFTESDVDGATKVMVINQTLAQSMFPNENPIGKRIVCCDGSAKTVIEIGR